MTSDLLIEEGCGRVPAATYDVAQWSPSTVTAGQEDEHLSAHLIYLCCKHTPSLVRHWFTGCALRNKVAFMEEWTERNVSIAQALTANA